MLPRRRTLNSFFYLLRAALLLLCALSGYARAENVVLYLKSGDKITGSIVSEYTNRLVLSNSWVNNLSVPLTEISRREIAAVGTNHIAGTNHFAGTNAP